MNSRLGLGGLLLWVISGLGVFAEDTSTSSPSLVVDLGYAVYEGVRNETQGLDSWRGYVGFTFDFLIRFSVRRTKSLTI